MTLFLHLITFDAIERYECRPLRITDNKLATYTAQIEPNQVLVYSDGRHVAMVVEDEEDLKMVLKSFPNGKIYPVDKKQLSKLHGKRGDIDYQLAKLRANGKIAYSQI